MAEARVRGFRHEHAAALIGFSPRESSASWASLRFLSREAIAPPSPASAQSDHPGGRRGVTGPRRRRSCDCGARSSRPSKRARRRTAGRPVRCLRKDVDGSELADCCMSGGAVVRPRRPRRLLLGGSDRQPAARRALPFAGKDSSEVSRPRDPDVAIGITSSRRAGAIALDECDRRVASVVQRAPAAEFGPKRSSARRADAPSRGQAPVRRRRRARSRSRRSDRPVPRRADDEGTRRRLARLSAPTRLAETCFPIQRNSPALPVARIVRPTFAKTRYSGVVLGRRPVRTTRRASLRPSSRTGVARAVVVLWCRWRFSSRKALVPGACRISCRVGSRGRACLTG
jgi:hypothetical protein